MSRWIWVAVVMLWCVGCTSGTSGVADDDEHLQEKMSRFEAEEQEVRFVAAETTVYATLTHPVDKQDAPAVVLVAGSGPTDRDWNNPLLPGDNGTAPELSRRLAEAGVASLRYDKRGTGMTSLSEPITWEDYLVELQAAVEFLGEEAGIDHGRIFAAGHSEGGVHVLRAAAEEWIDVRGVMLLATPGRSTEELLLTQVAEQLEGVGMPRDAVQRELSSLATAMQALQRGEPVEARQVSEIPGLVALVETLQTEDAEQFAAELIGWDPVEAITQLRNPVLIVQGLKDTQVDVDEDARRLLEAAEAQHQDVELVIADDADHVLKYQPVAREELSGQFSLTYNDPSRRLDETVLEAMILWIYDR